MRYCIKNPIRNQLISMSLVSVIMSIYNEPCSYIEEAVKSILNQTLEDLEFIIVNDNPARKDIGDYILSFKDSRIRFIQNDQNIGLAESMNKAVRLAQSPFLARMDADDISLPSRLEKEYDILNKKSFDLVFSDYLYIDKDSIPIASSPHPYYTPEKLPEIILTKSVIHHPTVMMTRAIYDKVGGYRNFPCAQDADMWLRMLYAGCRYYMIPEMLHKYRVNPNSVSSRKWYMQKVTIYYINELFIRRLQTGRDDFSVENYRRYLVRNKISDDEAAQRLRVTVGFLERAAEYNSEGKRFLSVLYRGMAFIHSRNARKNYLSNYIKRILFKRAMQQRNHENISDSPNI